ncbi:MAG: hypothetical protein GY906_35870 [bacterium]|nr:hypothetical protein [bacterium]
MKRSLVLVLGWCVLSTMVLANEPDRAELVGSQRFVDDATEPVFELITGDALKQQLRVVAIRSYAVFGFNNSGVLIQFPQSDNNVYASVRFSEARLLDAKGDAVKYERERGIYDHDEFSDQLRFIPVEGDEPVEFTLSEGSITLRYPIRIRTVAIKPGAASPAGLTVAVDGPFVSWSDPDEILTEAAAFTPYEQFRAFDTAGQRLEQHSFKGYSMRNGVSSEKYAYWGEVAEVRVDLIEEWAEIEISYSLPSIDRWPDSQVGTPPKNKEVKATPGGKVEMRLVQQGQPAPAATESGMSQDEALAQLKELGFRRFDANSFLLAATRGKTDALKLFIAGGMPVETESGGRTALKSAAMMGHVEAGKVLIKAGADVNSTDSSGAMPLHRLVMQCKATELVQAFIDAGADIKTKLPGNISVLKMAEVTNCTENARVLKEAGAK